MATMVIVIIFSGIPSCDTKDKQKRKQDNKKRALKLIKNVLKRSKT